MPVNRNFHSRVSRAVGLPLLLLSLTPFAALGQIVDSSQQRTGQAASTIAQVAQPLQAVATSADISSALPTQPVSKDYKIGVDDVLTVNVWHEPDLSRNITVRPDGKISLPLVGDIQASGKTPPQLQGELRSALAQFIKDPELTVIVAEIRSRRVNVIGQVFHPGTFAITQQMGVLDAIAEAGGLKEFAKQKEIYVLRETSAGKRTRLSYDYRDVLKGKNNAQDILLQTNDTVVVP